MTSDRVAASADPRLARELFDLKARVEAGFEDLAARPGTREL